MKQPTFRSLSLSPFFFVVLIFFSLHFVDCKQGPVDPPVKNPREYIWTIDTLAYPGSFQTTMLDIWGSSPTDAYVVGHNDRGFGKMFHFDGNKWTDVKLGTVQGGNIQGPIDLTAIQGFKASSIFAIGWRFFDNPNRPPNFLDSSLIIRFDGRQWQEETVPKGRRLWSISGTSPDDIWTCGYNGTLAHFDGVSWKKDSIAVSIPVDGDYMLSSIKTTSSGLVYVLGWVNQYKLFRTTNYFFVRKNQQWALADSFYVEPGHGDVKFGQNNLWVSPGGTLYSFGPHIFRWTGSSWLKIYEIFDALRRMAGTGDNNIFAVGDFGNILHYNGADWYLFNELKNPNVVYSSVWTDGKEVFVVGYFNDGSKTLILHGK